MAQGHGVALLPRLAVAANLARVSLHELSGDGLHRSILSVARASNTQRPIISTALDVLDATARS